MGELLENSEVKIILEV